MMTESIYLRLLYSLVLDVSLLTRTTTATVLLASYRLLRYCFAFYCYLFRLILAALATTRIVGRGRLTEQGLSQGGGGYMRT